MKVFHGAKRLDNVLEEVAKPICKKYGFVTYKIITNWTNIVGKYLAEQTIPQKIHFEREQTRNGILVIQVYNPGFALELQAIESMITERINTYFGYPAISRIKIVITRRKADHKNNMKKQELAKLAIAEEEQHEIKSAIEEVQDEELRMVLSNMAKGLFECK